MKKCVILEIESRAEFENRLNKYLADGYKVEALLSETNDKIFELEI